jgi:hypothetical protein
MGNTFQRLMRIGAMGGGGNLTLGFSNAEVGNVGSSTVVVTFTRQIQATNAKTGVTIKVNGGGVTISTGTIQADKHIVRYALAAPVAFGDVVTWEYNASTGNILDYVTSVALATVSAKSVTNNVASTGAANGALDFNYVTQSGLVAAIF